MAVNIFTTLLESYSGVRKQTWNLFEAKLTKEQESSFPMMQAAFDKALQGTPVMGQGVKKNIDFTPVEGQPGKVKISGSNVPAKILDAVSFTNTVINGKKNHPASFAYKLAAAWTPQEDGEKTPEKSKTEPSELSGLGTPQAFTPSQASDIADYIEQKDFETPEKSAKFVQALQKTIITPLSRTRLGQLFSKRPDISPIIQKQLFDLTSRFFSMASKAEQVTLADGTVVKVIRSERLSSQDKLAAQTITVRGNDGKGGVYFGRSGAEFIDEYKELQEYSQAYDHKTYGLSLGAAMNKYGQALFDTRIAPEGTDFSKMTKEEFEKLDLAAQKSTSVSTGSGQNDTTGKLAEDIVQLYGALASKDKSQVKEAVNELKKRLEKIASVRDTDIEHFETSLLSGEVDELSSFIKESKNIESTMRRKLDSLARKMNKMSEVVGLKGVIKSERPSAESKLGERADNRYIVDSDTTLNSDFQDVLTSNEDGTQTIDISVKEYDNALSETVLGSNSIHNAYGKGAVDEYDRLHIEHMDRAIEEGYLTEQQVQSCRDALEQDRQALETLENTLGSLTKPNKAVLGSYIKSLISSAGNQGFSDIETQKKYISELTAINDAIKTEKNPRKAAVKLFQLGRIVRSQNNPAYKAASLVNDSILSMGSFRNEIIMRGAPTEVALSKTHELLGRISQDAFSNDTEIIVGVSGASLKDSEGNVLVRNRIAGKESKQFAEGRIPLAGKERYMKTYDINQ